MPLTRNLKTIFYQTKGENKTFPRSSLTAFIGMHFRLFSQCLRRRKCTPFQVPGQTENSHPYLRQDVEDIGVHQPLLVPVLRHSQYLRRHRGQGRCGDVHVVAGGHGQEARDRLHSAQLASLSFSKLAA